MRCHKYKGGSEFKKALIGYLQGMEGFKLCYYNRIYFLRIFSKLVGTKFKALN